MSLIAHAGYGFKMKLNDIRNPAIFDLLSESSRENFFDDSFDDPDFVPVDAFNSMIPWDYVELLEEATNRTRPGIVVELPGYAETDHDEICIVLRSTYTSAYGNSAPLDLSTLTEEDKGIIEEFAQTYFKNTQLGWLIWPYYG